MFSHELLVGMKCMWNRGCRLSQRLHLGVLVRGVVVHDQVQVQLVRRLRVDQSQELDPLLMPMPRSCRCR